MKPFFRAVKHSLRYRWSIAGAFLCALLVAVIWSASITTVFPIVKIVLEGETAKTWIEHEIKSGEMIVGGLEKEIEALQQEHATTGDVLVANKLDLKQDRLLGEETSLEWYRNAQPTVNKYAPETGFQTLIVALLFLLTVTILKGILLIVGAILDARVAEKTVLDLRRIY